MNTVELGKLLTRSTYVIKAYDEGELFSSGSAVCVNSTGSLITAAHVISGRLPIKAEEKNDPNVKIFARLKRGDYIEYNPSFYGIVIRWPDGPLRKELIIDLALLNPKEPRSNVPYLKVSDKWFPVGTKVMMAGFPDELELPLQWDRAVDLTHPPISAKREETLQALEQVRELLMIKSGMVGHVNDLVIDPDGTGRRELRLAVYYIDNVMHSGSSGGPVINDEGEVIGIITKRAVTTVSYPDLENPNKEVPSGSALAITPYTLYEFLRDQVLDGNFSFKQKP